MSGRTPLATLAYYSAVLGPIIITMCVLTARYWLPWSFPYTPVVIAFLALSQVGIVGCVLWSSFALIGLLRYGAPQDRVPGPGWAWDPETLLLVTYVSRGDQPAALRRSMTISRDVLETYGVRYALEAVTDRAVSAEQRIVARQPVYYELVPADYQTPHGAKFKARALQYMLERRTARLAGDEDRHNIWVLHLDEESTLTPQALVGIREFTEVYDLRRTPGAIGQGEILYNAGLYGQDPLIDTVDAVRTGDDLGRFRMQFNWLHKPVFGMHGSFVLVPARIERKVTWDGGGRGSITEDAWFALSAWEHGVHFDWVDGFIREQSPFTLYDIIQQRRRWFCGISAVAADEKLKRSTRLMLQVCIGTWALGVVSLVFGVFTLLLFGREAFPPWLTLGLGFFCGFNIGVYIVGAVRNVLHSSLPWARRVLVVAQTVAAVVLLWPPAVEAIGVLYALWKPMTGFYIVRKELPHGDATALRSGDDSPALPLHSCE